MLTKIVVCCDQNNFSLERKFLSMAPVHFFYGAMLDIIHEQDVQQSIPLRNIYYLMRTSIDMSATMDLFLEITIRIHCKFNLLE